MMFGKVCVVFALLTTFICPSAHSAKNTATITFFLTAYGHPVGTIDTLTMAQSVSLQTALCGNNPVTKTTDYLRYFLPGVNQEEDQKIFVTFSDSLTHAIMYGRVATAISRTLNETDSLVVVIHQHDNWFTLELPEHHRLFAALATRSIGPFAFISFNNKEP